MSEQIWPTILENCFNGPHGRVANDLCINTSEPIGTFWPMLLFKNRFEGMLLPPTKKFEWHWGWKKRLLDLDLGADWMFYNAIEVCTIDIITKQKFLLTYLLSKILAFWGVCGLPLARSPEVSLVGYGWYWQFSAPYTCTVVSSQNCVCPLVCPMTI